MSPLLNRHLEGWEEKEAYVIVLYVHNRPHYFAQVLQALQCLSY
jgi:hypothetical protein